MDRVDELEAELIALKRAFIGFASLFAGRAATAEHVLRTAAEEILTEHPDVENSHAIAEASVRIADDLAAHCAYLRGLEREGRGIA